MFVGELLEEARKINWPQLLFSVTPGENVATDGAALG